MRRAGNLSEAILDRDNFRLAFSKAIAGKRHQDDARRFADRLEHNIARLMRQVDDGSFPVGRFHQFVIHDPKQRVIVLECAHIFHSECICAWAERQRTCPVCQTRIELRF